MRMTSKNTPSSFSARVYRTLHHVPRGKVTTYAALARAVGRPGASRAVGNALNRNPHAPRVPCHRVVRSDGAVGGFARGTKRKVAMLRREGVEVDKGKINLQRFRYKF